MTWIKFEIVSRRQHNFLSLFIASLLDGDINVLPSIGPTPDSNYQRYQTL